MARTPIGASAHASESGAPPQVWTYDPDFNRVTSYTDETGRRVVYEIDPANGNVLEERWIVGVDDRYSGGSEEDDVVASYVYTDGAGPLPAGLPILAEDALGRVTAFAYYTDAARLGLLHTVTYAVGTADEASVEYFYDPVTRELAAFEDELGRRTDFERDGLGRVVKVYQPPASPGGPRPTWTYVYCNCGRLALGRFGGVGLAWGCSALGGNDELRGVFLTAASSAFSLATSAFKTATCRS